MTSTTCNLQAPFPWFGGKSRVTNIVWPRFGEVVNYVEPFFGSGSVLLGRPTPFDGSETINDLDGFVANFWRSIKSDPETTAKWADNPVNENDLHAGHIWLVERSNDLRPRLEGDPNYYDPQIAGWWVWGICCWIGSGWCSGRGPWQSVEIDGVRKLVHLGDRGRGINRQLVHLGTRGQGINRKLVHLGDRGQGINRKRVKIFDWFDALSERLRNVRICSGDWSRVCGPSVTFKHGLTAVFLDPPYSEQANRDANVYNEDSLSVAHDVREWAIANGDNPKMRIALCGYDGEHGMPDTWDCVAWKANGGYANKSHDKSNQNSQRERIWFSPACLSAKQQELKL